MSQHLQTNLEQGKARIVDAPASAPHATVRHQVDVDRNFELPVDLYAATAGLYLAFLAVMLAGFATGGLIIPIAICAVLVVAIFGVPAIWTRLKDNNSKPMSLGQFAHKGIMTNTGHCSARDAAVQMLILPVLIILWACACVTIAALV
ncbi:hypothetical protein [uncultured Erythrobacter sp.]|uniref:hypothetical protein n=1 Tax=uncultured Erythrobacter sp. TaxID=263913 RepID=UPI00262E075E|nr:hypothetical protein [uncultured Erythrobacter sp.]